MNSIYLKKNEEKRFLKGSLWIFSNEVDRTSDSLENGDLVEVFDFHNNFLGTGYFNKNSLISVRMITEHHVQNISALIRERIISAFELRKVLYHNRNSFRMLFSESDLMPGLIIDKYNDTYVLQIYSLGMQKNIQAVISVLQSDFNAKNIFTKNAAYFRNLEGLPAEDQVFLGEMSEEVIDDGILKFKIDFRKSQKTGFFFDQSDNRFFLEKFSAGKYVLDAFCNSGGFGLHAAVGGADSLTFVDSSAHEIENSKYNYSLNDIKVPAEFIVGDVFEFMNGCLSAKRKFDLIVLDPPAFAKSKKSVPTAKKGYEKLHKLALRILSPDGFLAASSCSHHIDEKEFLNIINTAAYKLKKRLQLIHFNSASLDHPQLLGMSETSYLKFAIFRNLSG